MNSRTSHFILRFIISRAILPAAAVIVLSSLSSCIAPPPPRAYRPDVSRQLDHLAHDAPVTPLPDTGGWSVWEIN